MNAKRPMLLVLLLCFAPLLQAAGPGSEIEALIAALGTSKCDFERNGHWYGPAEAQTHVRRKYAWLQGRGMADTPELFIERAASRSSRSGKPYHVRCPGKPAVEAGDWFRAQLSRLRAKPGAARAPAG